MSQVYKLATSPLRVAMKLLEQEDQFSRFREHDELYQKLLQSTSVLFVAESETEKGMPCLARIRVLSGLSSFLMGMDELDGEPVPQRIIITVWEQGWETLEEDQRAALMFHELCHLRAKLVEGEWRFSLVGHDLEEFNAVVQRFGVWMPNIHKFIESCRSGQKSLFGITEVEQRGNTTHITMKLPSSEEAS
ncbi:MAG: putative metallopeptidase [Armatimonadota bacterium]|nr:putative metallopeptidase [Fimbriimonadaceae bacterium]